ncbi:MAG: hypothetical protein JSS27_17580 [Planctomycetes bacterium]|nr:hypothetical protein [Planctomycetota bacterium]
MNRVLLIAGRGAFAAAVFVLAVALVQPTSAAEPLAGALGALQQVGREGAGNVAATAAWSQVAAATPAELPTILAALDKAGPVGANYLRAAVDAIAERSLQQGQPLPHDALEKYVLTTTHGPRSRRLAFEWLGKIDPTAGDRLIPGFLDDPSLELRRDAVARAIAEGTQQIEAAQEDELARQSGVSKLEKAFAAARDLDQIAALDKKLGELKVKVDLPKHFGFVMNWRLIGPFDNRNGVGFDVAYPPEKEIDFAAKYQGKAGDIGWVEHASADRHGKFDLNTMLGKDMGCVAYAAVEFHAPAERDIDIRLGCICACKYWLNGTLLGTHHIYHAGSSIDQYQARARLKSGRNVILVKICQNEQTEKWAQDWEFQLRVCDAIGTAVLSSKTSNPAAHVKRAKHETQQARN